MVIATKWRSSYAGRRWGEDVQGLDGAFRANLEIDAAQVCVCMDDGAPNKEAQQLPAYHHQPRGQVKIMHLPWSLPGVVSCAMEKEHEARILSAGHLRAQITGMAAIGQQSVLTSAMTTFLRSQPIIGGQSPFPRRAQNKHVSKASSGGRTMTSFPSSGGPASRWGSTTKRAPRRQHLFQYWPPCPTSTLKAGEVRPMSDAAGDKLVSGSSFCWNSAVLLQASPSPSFPLQPPPTPTIPIGPGGCTGKKEMKERWKEDSESGVQSSTRYFPTDMILHSPLSSSTVPT